jgi:hypothetical protein
VMGKGWEAPRGPEWDDQQVIPGHWDTSLLQPSGFLATGGWPIFTLNQSCMAHSNGCTILEFPTSEGRMQRRFSFTFQDFLLFFAQVTFLLLQNPENFLSDIRGLTRLLSGCIQKVSGSSGFKLSYHRCSCSSAQHYQAPTFLDLFLLPEDTHGKNFMARLLPLFLRKLHPLGTPHQVSVSERNEAMTHSLATFSQKPSFDYFQEGSNKGS